MLFSYSVDVSWHQQLRISAITAVICIFLLVAPTLSAQSNDLDPPLIEHDLQDRGTPGETQDFSATVVDDQALAEVRLYYRYNGETSFTDIIMTPIASSAVYTVSLDTEAGDLRAIEYYIEARDKAGNRIVQGHPFNPMVRLMGNEETQVAENTQDAIPDTSRRRRWLYVGLGVLAAGAVAAAANGGGKDDGNDDFVVTVDPP